MAPEAITEINLKSLPLVAKGKVRELYRIDASTLLMAVTDRISAYDVILSSGIPEKGTLLTQASRHWFSYLESQIPELKHHVLSWDPPSPEQGVSREEAEKLRGRCLQIKSMKIFPVEAIVRGYLTGSAWKEYQKTGTVHGMKQAEGLQNASKFPHPIYTPSTKAPAGESDENISVEQARKIVGEKYADRIESLALKLYTCASDYAAARGIVLADTKFEFGLDEATDEIYLVDEVLTPDSSRFWPAPVKVGEEQPSFDKQYVRDYLTSNGLKGKQDVGLPDDVVEATRSKYKEVYEKLTGRTLEEALKELA